MCRAACETTSPMVIRRAYRIDSWVDRSSVCLYIVISISNAQCPEYCGKRSSSCHSDIHNSPHLIEIPFRWIIRDKLIRVFFFGNSMVVRSGNWMNCIYNLYIGRQLLWQIAVEYGDANIQESQPKKYFDRMSSYNMLVVRDDDHWSNMAASTRTRGTVGSVWEWICCISS